MEKRTLKFLICFLLFYSTLSFSNESPVINTQPEESITLKNTIKIRPLLTKDTAAARKWIHEVSNTFLNAASHLETLRKRENRTVETQNEPSRFSFRNLIKRRNSQANCEFRLFLRVFSNALPSLEQAIQSCGTYKCVRRLRIAQDHFIQFRKAFKTRSQDRTTFENYFISTGLEEAIKMKSSQIVETSSSDELVILELFKAVMGAEISPLDMINQISKPSAAL